MYRTILTLLLLYYTNINSKFNQIKASNVLFLFFSYGFIVRTRLSADKCVKDLRERVRKREHQLRGKRQRMPERNRDWVKLEKGNTRERITVVAKLYLQAVLSTHELPFKMRLTFIILFNKISPIFKCRPDSLLSLSALGICFFSTFLYIILNANCFYVSFIQHLNCLTKKEWKWLGFFLW